jgi:hypothetical protein
MGAAVMTAMKVATLKLHEITVMAKNDAGRMELIDRCTINATDTADAAKRYAALFAEGSR